MRSSPTVGKKALRILERSAALTESFAAQVDQIRANLAFARGNSTEHD